MLALAASSIGLEIWEAFSTPPMEATKTVSKTGRKLLLKALLWGKRSISAIILQDCSDRSDPRVSRGFFSLPVATTTPQSPWIWPASTKTTDRICFARAVAATAGLLNDAGNQRPFQGEVGFLAEKHDLKRFTPAVTSSQVTGLSL